MKYNINGYFAGRNTLGWQIKDGKEEMSSVRSWLRSF